MLRITWVRKASNSAVLPPWAGRLSSWLRNTSRSSWIPLIVWLGLPCFFSAATSPPRALSCSLVLPSSTCKGFQLLLFGGQCLQLAVQLRDQLRRAFLLGLEITGQLVEAFALAAELVAHIGLLAFLAAEFLLQLLDLQAQRLAFAGDAGLAGDHLAANVVEAPGGFLADPYEAFLGRHQLLFHQADLLVAPPTHPGEGDQHRPEQGPERAGRGRTALLGVDDPALLRFVDVPRVVAEFITVGSIGGQAGHIVEFVESIVTHGENL